MGRQGQAGDGRVWTRVVRQLGAYKRRGINLAEVVLTVVAFAVLRAAHMVADTPLWIYVVLVVAGGIASGVAFRFWGADCTSRELHLRVAVNIAFTTAVIYATGWGPMLGIGYMYIASDAIKHSGSRAAAPSLVWTVVGIAAGQLAIATNAAPTYLDAPEVHGLGALTALCLCFLIHSAGVTTDEKERAEAEVRRSEERFRSLVQNGSDVVALVEPDGKVQYISPSFERLGFATDASGDGPQLHPDDIERAAQAFMSVLSDRRRVVHVEVRLQRTDGSWRWLDVTLSNQCAEPSIKGVVANFHDVTERKQFEERLTHAAYHDPLTGLSNRAGFLARMERAAERAHREHLTTALLFLDLDWFKVINDSHGHNTGDRVLMEVATRLRGCVRAEDIIGRFGGDEFTILIEDAHQRMATEFAERITSVLRAPFHVNGRDLPITASVGLVVTDSFDDVDDLLRGADLAMYLAKEKGRARWELFDPNSQEPTPFNELVD